MTDVSVFIIVAAFTALTWLLIALCDRLMGGKP